MAALDERYASLRNPESKSDGTLGAGGASDLFNLLGGKLPVRPRLYDRPTDLRPTHPVSDVADLRRRNAKFGSQRAVRALRLRSDRQNLRRPDDGARVLNTFRVCAVSDPVGVILSASTPRQVGGTAIIRRAIEVPAFQASWTRPMEGRADRLVHGRLPDFAMPAQRNAEISTGDDPRLENPPSPVHQADRAPAVGLRCHSIEGSNSASIGGLVETFKAWDRQPNL